jgi:hypothetical protein
MNPAVTHTLAVAGAGACLLALAMFSLYRLDRWVDRKLAEDHERNGTRPRIRRRP